MTVKKDFPQARILTWDEMDALAEQGLNVQEHLGVPQEELVGIQSKAIRWIVKNVFKDYDFAGCGYDQVFKLGLECFELTYGSLAQEKN